MLRNKRKTTKKPHAGPGRAASIMLTLLMVIMMTSFNISSAFAASESGDPVREVHNVEIGSKRYCFFVQNNVVLTPEEIEAMTDNELVNEIVDRAGLYMKERNCTKASHKAITAEDWINRDGSFLLSDSDMEKLRSAAPTDGETVRLHMDLRISTEPADEEKKEDESSETGKNDDGKTDGTDDQTSGSDDQASDTDDQSQGTDDQTSGTDEQTSGTDDQTSGTDEQTSGTDDQTQDEDNTEDETDPAPVKRHIYSTYKMLSPKLLFVVVATETDAKTEEDVCKPEKTPAPKPDNSGGGGGGGSEPQEMLPELRTISMTDRSGGPLQETLEDGTPVTLEWIEPKRNRSGKEGTSFLDHIPGGAAGLGLMTAAAAGLIAAIIIGRKRQEEEE